MFSVYKKLRDIAHFLDEELGVYLGEQSLLQKYLVTLSSLIQNNVFHVR